MIPETGDYGVYGTRREKKQKGEHKREGEHKRKGEHKVRTLQSAHMSPNPVGANLVFTLPLLALLFPLALLFLPRRHLKTTRFGYAKT